MGTHLDSPDTTELLGVSLSESELKLSLESDFLMHQLEDIPELIMLIT